MFQKIWQAFLIGAIVLYAGNIMIATEQCSRIEKSGSVVRVAAAGLFFLTDNWTNKSDQASFRAGAHSLELWLENIVRVTFFGKDTKCPGIGGEPDPKLLPPSVTPIAPSPALQSHVEPVPAPAEQAAPPVNPNPYNLPSLPEAGSAVPAAGSPSK